MSRSVQNDKRTPFIVASQSGQVDFTELYDCPIAAGGMFINNIKGPL